MTPCSYDSIAAGTTHSLFRVIVPPMSQHLQNGGLVLFYKHFFINPFVFTCKCFNTFDHPITKLPVSIHIFS